MSPNPRAVPLQRLAAPVALTRQVILLVMPFAMAATVVLNLSDRVPTQLERSAYRLGVGPRLADGVAGVEPFVLAHVFGWTAVAFAVALAVGRVGWMPVTATMLAGAGVAIEIVQELATRVRAFETADIAANMVGVTAGTVLAALVVTAGRLPRAS